MRIAAFAAALLAAAAARGSSVSDEVSVGGTQTTPQNPRSGSVSNLLTSSFDLGERWTVSAGAQVTLESPTPAPAGSAFGDLGGTVTDFSAGVDWEATDSWTFGVTLDVSPESSIGSVARFPVQGRPTDVLIRAASSNASVELLAGYDTAGSSDLEWSFTGGITFGRFRTNQRIEAAQHSDDRTDVSLAELRAQCAPEGSRCRALVPAIDGVADELRSARISAGVLATVQADTDLALDVDYYGYADDPANVGVFAIGTAGRLGEGAPIAPLRFLVRPQAAHRFGALSLKLWAQAGEYVPGVGQGTAGVGARAQYKLSRAFRTWISASGQRDVDASGQVTRSGRLALGVGYRF
jgi:hypothetical protein